MKVKAEKEAEVEMEAEAEAEVEAGVEAEMELLAAEVASLQIYNTQIKQMSGGF